MASLSASAANAAACALTMCNPTEQRSASEAADTVAKLTEASAVRAQAAFPAVARAASSAASAATTAAAILSVASYSKAADTTSGQQTAQRVATAALQHVNSWQPFVAAVPACKLSYIIPWSSRPIRVAVQPCSQGSRRVQPEI